MTVQRCVLVDPDTRRRAIVREHLREISMDVVECNWVREIDPESLEDEIFLAFDQGQTVASITKLLAQNLATNSIIAYSAEPEIDRVVQSVKAGADSYLVWPFTAHQLLPLFRKIERQASSSVGNQRSEAQAKQVIKRLTPREREVLSGVIHGMSNQQIGAVLGISVRTVEIHRANMIRKIGARNSAAAVKFALDAGFNDATLSQSSTGDWFGEAA